MNCTSGVGSLIKFNRIIRVGVALLHLSIVPSVAMAESDTVIGLHGPFTGPASWIGLGGRDGAALAIDEINSAGGIHGRKLRLVAYDDANKPSEAEAVVKKLVESDNVFAIVASGPSNTVVVGAAEAMRVNSLYINATGTNPAIIDNKSKWIFSASVIDIRDVTEIEANFIASYIKPGKIALLRAADVGSQSYSDALHKWMKGTYQIPIVTEQTFNRGDTDFSSQLLTLRGQDVDLLVLSGPYLETARIIRQVRELGIKIPIKADVAAMNLGLLTIAGAAAEGLYVATVPPFFNGDPDENMVEFERRYRERHPGYPDDRPNFVDMYVYGAVYVLAEGMKRAGSDADPEAVIAALETLENYVPSQSWPSAVDVSHPTTYVRNRAGNRAMSYFRVVDGKFERIRDYTLPSLSTAFPSNNELE